MTSAYISGFVKTAIAFNVKNPLGLLMRARGLFARGTAAARSRLGDKLVDTVIGAGKEVMRARNAMLPMVATPLVTT
jgi:hypothetical protein